MLFSDAERTINVPDMIFTMLEEAQTFFFSLSLTPSYLTAPSVLVVQNCPQKSTVCFMSNEIIPIGKEVRDLERIGTFNGDQ